MKLAKLIVLLGGALGVLAFFVPLATLRYNQQEIAVSGLDVVNGMTALEAIVDQASAPAQAKTSTYQTLTEIKTVILACFVPGALLALFGLVAVARWRMGRIGGIAAISLGVLAFLVFFALSRGAAEAEDIGAAGPAVYLIAACGLLGIAGGSLAVVSPDLRDKT